MTFGFSKGDSAAGEIGKLEVPVTAAAILVACLALLTLLYVERPTWGAAIVFSGSGAGIIAGIVSAFYVAKGLKLTISQRNALLMDNKIERAFVMAERWNDPRFASLREQWRKLLSEIDGKTDGDVCTLLIGDSHKKTVAADVLNFYEEISYAVRCDYADPATLKQISRSIVVGYYSAISPWIDRVRRDRHQPSAYEHFEWLAKQWK